MPNYLKKYQQKIASSVQKCKQLQLSKLYKNYTLQKKIYKAKKLSNKNNKIKKHGENTLKVQIKNNKLAHAFCQGF